MAHTHCIFRGSVSAQWETELGPRISALLAGRLEFYSNLYVSVGQLPDLLEVTCVLYNNDGNSSQFSDIFYKHFIL